MATITSTPTGGNLTVNGTTQVSGTISWSKPTIPSGATISSCVLTGTATASLSKGSATITVNGTTVTSETQFTINLGTANNTTSVTTTAKGGNKQSKGTVSFSNLVYTVTYTSDVPVTGITLSPTNITVQQNKSVIVNAILTPDGSADEIIWSINDTNIATLTTQASSTQIGINGKTVGEATITATTVKSGISVSEKVTVEPLMVEVKPEVCLFAGAYGNAAQGEKITDYSSIIDIDFSGTGEFLSLKPLNINIIDKTYSLYEIQYYNISNYSFSQLYSHEDIHNNKYIAEYSFNDEVTLKENHILRIYLFQAAFKTYYTVIFKDWNVTTLKTETVEEGSAATAPSNPVRDGYTFTGWDIDFSNVTSDLTVTAQYEKELEVIEWTGIGTIATGLKAHAGNDGYFHDNYKINLDWENESFDIIIVDELGRSSSYSYNQAYIGDIKIGDTEFSILFSDGAVIIHGNDSMLDYYNSDYGYYPFVVSFTKKGIYVKSSAATGEYSTPELLSGSENIYEINQPIYLIDDGLIHSSVSNQENPKYDILFDLAVSEYSEQTEEPEEDIIEWTGIGTVASNLSSDINHDNYKINIDWDNECFDVVITDHAVDLTDFNYSTIGELRIGDESYVIIFDSKMELCNLHDEVIVKGTEGNLPSTLRFFKNGIYLLENDIIVDQITDVNYTSNDPILFYNSPSYKGNETKFDLIVNELPNEEPEEPVIPVEKTIALRPISSTEDSGYNNSWTDIANTYDTDTSTSGTIIVTGSSQSGFKRKYVDTIFNFDNPIPANATINSAVLTIRAKQSATTNLNMTVSIGSNEVIGSTLLSSSSANYTADITNYVKDLNQLNINLTSAATSNRTFTLYDVRVDVSYTVYETSNPTTYTVTFKDWDGTTLKTETVEEGVSATAPSNPSRVGYNFTGWDKSFNNITGDLIVTAQYEKELEKNELLKLGENTIDSLYIGDQRIIQMYLNGQPLI